MIEQNPWKTPFGKLLIGSSVVAAVVGFSIAAGFAAHFEREADPPQEVYSEAETQAADFGDEPSAFQSDSEYTSGQRSVVTDPEGYAAVLNDLPAATTDVQATTETEFGLYEEEPSDASPSEEAEHPVATADTSPSRDQGQ